MARIFITGSSSGLGQMTATSLINQGHEVVLHARNEKRAQDVLENVPGAEDILIGNLANIEESKQLAEDVNTMGRFDAIIHNAGVYRASVEQILAVNTLAPYILTSLIKKPKRLIYLSSGMHKQGNPSLEKMILEKGDISYSDSKLHVVLLTKAVARKWPEVYANAVDPDVQEKFLTICEYLFSGYSVCQPSFRRFGKKPDSGVMIFMILAPHQKRLPFKA